MFSPNRRMSIPITLANLGPLRRLAGVWESAKGVDLNPKAEGPEQRKYIERIEMQPIDPQAMVRNYSMACAIMFISIRKKKTSPSTTQVGYWLWEPATGLVLQSLAIPRGQVALASGQATPDAASLVLTATRGQTEYGICSTAFLEYAFRTDSYRIEITFKRRWKLELCFRHHADGEGSGRTLPPPRPQHPAQGRRTGTQSLDAVESRAGQVTA